jgi:WD repeat-containing protein 19
MSLAFVDDKSDGFIFNPVNGNLVKIPELPSTIQGIVWETLEAEKVFFLCLFFELE